MRIPPLYRSPAMQRFMAGVAVGGCISWVIFLIMFGIVQEKNTIKIKDQAVTIDQLKSRIEIWQNDYQKLNEKNEELLTIQEITVELVGHEKYNITDSQSIFTVKESVKDDLKSLIAKDLATVNKNKEIIKKTIENKVVTINGKKYGLHIREIYFYTTIELTVELRLAD